MNHTALANLRTPRPSVSVGAGEWALAVPYVVLNVGLLGGAVYYGANGKYLPAALLGGGLVALHTI